MIPRTATASRPTPGLLITPRHGGEDLPVWAPRPPRGGWSAAAAFASSLAYVEHLDALQTGASSQRLTSAVYRDLLTALPADVKRAELVERLRGVDRFAEHFGVRDAEPEAEPPPF